MWATFAIVLAATFGLVWLLDRQRAAFILCALSIAVAAAAFSELGMMHAESAPEYRAWLRFFYLPVFLTFAAQLLFVHNYLGTGRVWLLWVAISARVIVVVMNLAGFDFIHVTSLRREKVFGEPVSVVDAASHSSWQWFAFASLILVLTYVLDAAARHWRKGGQDSRRKAVAVGAGIVVPLLCSVVSTQFLAFGILGGAVSNAPWFLGALFMMAYEFGRDFTLGKRAQVELAQLRTQLAHEQRITMLGQLATALSHELRQPLTANQLNVGAALRLLKSEKPDLEELRAALEDVQEGHRRAAEIIVRMQQFLQQRAIDLQPLGMEEVVENAVSLVRAQANSHNVRITLSVEPGLPKILGDRVHLTQVLLNLLLNAIQATQSSPPNFRRVAVEVHADRAKNEVEVTVRDSGPGIAESEMGQLFKPFFTTKPEGMGIGLTLARSIIEAHGGRLWLDEGSRHGGAAFRFTVATAEACSAEYLPGAVTEMPEKA
jgi:signal transduction histidine kinase